MSEVHVSHTKAKLVRRKKISGETGPLTAFKTPRQNGQGLSLNPLGALNDYSHTTTNANSYCFSLYINKESHEILFNLKSTDKKQVSVK